MANFLDFLSPARFLHSSQKNQKNPYDAARPWMDKEEELYNNNFNPYIERGNRAGQEASDTYSSMSQDPAEHYQKWASTYNPRRGYEGIKNDERYRQAEQEAAAGGYAGTDYDRDRRERLANELQDADFDRYMNHIMGIEKSGLEGQSNFSNAGQNAGTNQAQLLGQNYGAHGQMDFKNAEFQNSQKNALLKALLPLIGQIGGSYFGPAGSAAGGALGQSLAGGGQQSLDSGNWNTSRERGGRGW
jgi:hypothetical protein